MTDSFLEIQFPSAISYGSTGGPQFSTTITMTGAGREKRNVNWSTARAVYDVSHGVKTPTEYAQLVGFFRVVQGRATGFRYKDWTDYAATNEPIATTATGQTTYSLIKTYTAGSTNHVRRIHKPVAGTVQPYLAGVLQTTGFTIDTANGYIVFTSAPTAGQALTASFQFDVPVRFDTDVLRGTIEEYNALSWGNIPLVEVQWTVTA